jgi:DNA helicase HerA-like ATPase
MNILTPAVQADVLAASTDDAATAAGSLNTHALNTHAADDSSREPAAAPITRMRAGRVVSTAGSQVIILLDRDASGLDAVQMGALVSVRSPHALVFGIIEGLSTPMPIQSGGGQPGEGNELKIAEIGLLGEVPDHASSIAGSFRRGVTKLPSLDATVYLANEDDTAVVYALNKRRAVSIGSVHQDPRVPARISVDDMLCKHFAILGTTGTGKSCALTLILKRILEQNPNGHVLLLDPHGEYGRAFGARAEHLTKETFRLPYWLCNFEELTEVVFGHEKHDMIMEIVHLRDLVLSAKMNFAGNARDAGWITVDTPVPYSLGDLNRLLDQAIGSLENRSTLPPYLRLKSRINALQSDRRFDFMFDTGLVVRDDFAALLGRILRVPANGKPLAILDLASIPSEVLNVVVAVICRLAFDFAVLGGQKMPLLLVCEEAHRYAPQDTALGFEPAKRALSRIAKEGRKYGISLGVISQRPSELASTILSQCNTVFAFRMSNERDQEIIQATLAEASAAMFSVLPFLGGSEAIAIGEGVPVPMRLRFDVLPEGERPLSNSAPFSDRWGNADLSESSELDRVVAAMRGRRSS